MLLLIWVLLSFLTALYGMDRASGFWGTFLLALFLSPLLLFIILVILDKVRPLAVEKKVAN